MNSADQKHLDRVASLGCIVCLNENLGETPPEIHHIRTGYGKGQRAPHTETLPLCRFHHRLADGTLNFNRQVAYHYSPEEFENRYGTEIELLKQVKRLIYPHDVV